MAPQPPCLNPWTSKEVARLRELAHLGAAGAAAELGRSVHAVKAMAKRKRISLRRPGERSGLALGQPAGQSWARRTDPALAALREAILAGDADVDDLEDIARRPLRLAQGAPLCPGCLARPQEVRRTGLCRPCHLRHLAQAHREHQEDRAAQRELWRERQRKHRARQRGTDPDDLDLEAANN